MQITSVDAGPNGTYFKSPLATANKTATALPTIAHTNEYTEAVSGLFTHASFFVAQASACCMHLCVVAASRCLLGSPFRVPFRAPGAPRTRLLLTPAKHSRHAKRHGAATYAKLCILQSGHSQVTVRSQSGHSQVTVRSCK